MASTDTALLQTIAGFLGNVFEWYDFGIYGFFSDTIAQVFFPPTDDSNNNLTYSYIIFGGAFLMRPMGGLLAGHIGDSHGRKRALVFSLLSMTVPTVAMGLLPTYQRVGNWSPALLALFRLLQGFSVGGQLPSSLVYTLETKPKEHWGYYGSIFSISNGIGSVMANIVGALLRTLLTEEQIVQFGWRVAFLTGILIAPVAVLLHAYGEEPSIDDVNREIVQDGVRSMSEASRANSTISASSQSSRPLVEALQRENWLALLSAFLTPMLAGAGYYITFVWMAIYMKTLIDPPVAGAFWVNLLATICGYGFPSITAGVLSDRYGSKRIMTVGALGVGIVAPVMVWIISWGVTWKAFLAQWTIGLFLSIFTGPMWAWLPSNFPPRVRLTSAALSYNLGMCLAAGFSPAVATALVHGYGPVAPAILYSFFALVALVGLFVSTKVNLQRVETDVATQQVDGMDDDSIDESSNHLI